MEYMLHVGTDEPRGDAQAADRENDPMSNTVSNYGQSPSQSAYGSPSQRASLQRYQTPESDQLAIAKQKARDDSDMLMADNESGAHVAAPNRAQSNTIPNPNL